MERKEQTGHICRWMALGIMTAIVIVGCTIVIGLFEWRDRKEIECRNAELHQWRKNVHDLNLHIAELSLLGEMVADWDSTDVNEYHSLRLEVNSMLQGIADICLQEDSDTICHLLAEKEQLLLDIKDAMQDLNAPFSCPKRAETASSAESVPQSTTSKGLSALLLCRCIFSAICSLPVPLSPNIITAMSLLANNSAILYIRRNFSLLR
jgi:two-component system, NarL family, sensor histidine kinase EvgS